MSDQLPDVRGGAGYDIEAIPVIIAAPDGTTSSPSAGTADPANSTTVALGADEEFIGEWVTNGDPQIAFNAIADQDGTFYLEFSPDGGSTIALSKPYTVADGDSRFDALVKMPGRSHRVRFVNGSTAQGNLVILTATGGGLYPYSVGPRDRPKFITVSATVDSGTPELYRCLVDLSDTANFPHRDSGHIELNAVFFAIKKLSNSDGLIQMGVITRIDGTDADVIYVQGTFYSAGEGRSVVRDRFYRDAPVSLKVENGQLVDAASGEAATNIAALNTGTQILSPRGLITPAVGDVVVRFLRNSGGEASAFASAQYSSQR